MILEEKAESTVNLISKPWDRLARKASVNPMSEGVMTLRTTAVSSLSVRVNSSVGIHTGNSLAFLMTPSNDYRLASMRLNVPVSIDTLSGDMGHRTSQFMGSQRALKADRNSGTVAAKWSLE
jgi:hypothetical protein